MRADVAEEADQGRRRNYAVEQPAEKTAARLVGFVGSASRFRGGTVGRHRRAGGHSRTTIWHAAEFSRGTGSRKYVQKASRNLGAPPPPRRGAPPPPGEGGRGEA